MVTRTSAVSVFASLFKTLGFKATRAANPTDERSPATPSLLIPGNSQQEKSEYLRREWRWIDLHKGERLKFRVDSHSERRLTVAVVKSSGKVFIKPFGDKGPVTISVTREKGNPLEVCLESRGLPGIELQMAVALMGWLKERGFEIVTFKTHVCFGTARWVLPFIQALADSGVTLEDSVLQSRKRDLYLTRFVLRTMNFGPAAVHVQPEEPFLASPGSRNSEVSS